MRLIVQALESLKIPYMITGSHASAYYGEPRFTKDIDIIADLKEERVDEFVKFFPADKFYVSQRHDKGRDKKARSI